MGTPTLSTPSTIDVLSAIPTRIHSSCDFVQALMKLQRAAQLITSSVDLDELLDRVVNDIAVSIGCVEVSVWLRDPEGDDMVLHGVRGCPVYKKGDRAKMGQWGMGWSGGINRRDAVRPGRERRSLLCCVWIRTRSLRSSFR
jgi:phosphoserine phosphatase RsbU/P